MECDKTSRRKKTCVIHPIINVGVILELILPVGLAVRGSNVSHGSGLGPNYFSLFINEIKKCILLCKAGVPKIFQINPLINI